MPAYSPGNQKEKLKYEAGEEKMIVRAYQHDQLQEMLKSDDRQCLMKNWSILQLGAHLLQ